MTKPLLYDLIALVFPRVIGWANAEGHAEGHAEKKGSYLLGKHHGKAKAARDIARHTMAYMKTWYGGEVQSRTTTDGILTYTIEIPPDHPPAGLDADNA